VIGTGEKPQQYQQRQNHVVPGTKTDGDRDETDAGEAKSNYTGAAEAVTDPPTEELRESRSNRIRRKQQSGFQITDPQIGFNESDQRREQAGGQIMRQVSIGENQGVDTAPFLSQPA